MSDARITELEREIARLADVIGRDLRSLSRRLSRLESSASAYGGQACECGAAIVQPDTGRPRKRCADCDHANRLSLRRARYIGRKFSHVSSFLVPETPLPAE